MREKESVSDVMVSICCITYNQEKYISEAIDSFIRQKTNFSFEIIIHDDASTDRTEAIISEYQNRYPKLIFPVFADENRLSKGKDIFGDYIYPHAHGKYIAYCEGDDFWTDDNKLQRQVDFLEQHSDYSAIAHDSYLFYEGMRNKEKFSSINISREILPEEIINNWGRLFQTASIMLRRSVAEQRVKERPDFYLMIMPVLDQPIMLYTMLHGKVYYINECLAAYRVDSVGSWSQTKYSDREYMLDYYKKMYKMLIAVDTYSKNKYHTIISHKIIQMKREEIDMQDKLGHINELKSLSLWYYLKWCGIKWGVYMYLKINHPRVFAICAHDVKE